MPRVPALADPGQPLGGSHPPGASNSDSFPAQGLASSGALLPAAHTCVLLLNVPQMTQTRCCLLPVLKGLPDTEVTGTRRCAPCQGGPGASALSPQAQPSTAWLPLKPPTEEPPWKKSLPGWGQGIDPRKHGPRQGRWRQLRQLSKQSAGSQAPRSLASLLGGCWGPREGPRGGGSSPSRLAPGGGPV